MTNEKKLILLAEIAEAVDVATTVDDLKKQMAKIVKILREDAAADEFPHLNPT